MQSKAVFCSMVVEGADPSVRKSGMAGSWEAQTLFPAWLTHFGIEHNSVWSNFKSQDVN
jgi:hypothetical protein